MRALLLQLLLLHVAQVWAAGGVPELALAQAMLCSYGTRSAGPNTNCSRQPCCWQRPWQLHKPDQAWPCCWVLLLLLLVVLQLLVVGAKGLELEG